MNWITLKSETQLDEIREKSKEKPQLIFKHSIRCGISGMAKNRLERSEQPATIDFYYLDLINYRSLSNMLSEYFMVNHESPQILLIKDGECIYDESHSAIRMDEILEKADLG